MISLANKKEAVIIIMPMRNSSTTVVSALALGHDIRTALMWGPINSMSVVQHVGAQAGLLMRPELEAWLTKAPEDYMPKVI